MILIDSTWKSNDEAQLPGRVQRRREVQNADVTVGHRIIGSAPWSQAEDWLVNRQHHSRFIETALEQRRSEQRARGGVVDEEVIVIDD